MIRRREVLRLIGGAAVVTLLCLLLLALLGYMYLSWKLENGSKAPNPVIGVPEETRPIANIPSYTGPHPRLVPRPEDPYPYPIAIGEVGPHKTLYAGPPQYPFYCRTFDSGLGQPLVDNQKGIGVPVYKEVGEEITKEVIGYSKDCLIPTQVHYYYNRVDEDRFYPLEDATNDISQIEINGRLIDFIVRVETGSINRFNYVIAALKGPQETLQQPSGLNWNKRLIYQFRGGVGIGKVQGRVSLDGLLKRRIEQLKLGYAVAYSSANQTSNHYNIWLAEETALRVKRQFIALYGEPLYTVGVGGSGGAIQQYLIAQNLPGLIDAAIPLYSYPDMITQTQYVFDCELLEYYFDITASDNPRWRSWSERQRIEGTSSSSKHFSSRSWLYDLAMMVHDQPPHLYSGSNECVTAWRGLTQLVNNPRYIHHAGRYSEAILQDEHWSYWDDMKYFLGTNHQGYARQTWDNVGVQYGLQALKREQITVKEFLHLNANIGSWKEPAKMRAARYWKLGGVGGLSKFSPWSHHNMVLSPDGGKSPAQRQKGDLKAIEAAYRSGQVFIGMADIPIIDLRHYLDDELDMHHSFASLSVRQRLINARGHADNQLIWMSRVPHNPVPQAFEVIDEWMENIRRTPGVRAADNKPKHAEDLCFNHKGQIMAQGKTVWDGRWNNKPDGACSELYPAFQESRMVAGAPVTGEVFKCALRPVRDAIDSGAYGTVDMREYQSELERIFPEGVCDYTLPDLGLPKALLSKVDGNEPLQVPINP